MEKVKEFCNTTIGKCCIAGAAFLLVTACVNIIYRKKETKRIEECEQMMKQKV